MPQAAYQRGDSFQSVDARLNSPGSFAKFQDALTANPRTGVKVTRVADYYAEQSTMLTKLITAPGVLLAALMTVGRIFGALYTMSSAVAARTREIAPLRSLEFVRGAIILALMIESLLLALPSAQPGFRSPRPCGSGSARDHFALGPFLGVTYNRGQERERVEESLTRLRAQPRRR